MASGEMEELRRQLLLKLGEMDALVATQADQVAAAVAPVPARDAPNEAALAELLAVVRLLPDWLGCLGQFVQEVSEVARKITTVPAPERPLQCALFPNPVEHRSQIERHHAQQHLLQRNRARVALLESRRVVNALADSAAAVGSDIEAAAQVATECRLLSGRGLSAASVAAGLEDLLDETWARARTPQRLRLEAERQLAINESLVRRHVDARGAAANLGRLVHHLLAAKYPRPPPPPGKDLPRLKVMALLLGFEDADAVVSLRTMLSSTKVLLVTPQEALETCVAAFRAEGPGLPLLESREPPPPVEAPPEDPDAVTQLLPGGLREQLEALKPAPSHKEAETQTGPEVQPPLSTAASLGRAALDTLRLQQPLSDWTMAALVLEHLRLNLGPETLGFVLLGFPSTFEQSRIFEASITGQWVPNPDNPEEVRGGPRTLVQSSIVPDAPDAAEFAQPFRTIFTSVVAVSPADPPQCLSLINEIYLRQEVLACYHCAAIDDSMIRSITELLLRESPHPSPPSLPPLEASVFEEFSVPDDVALGLAALWESIETAYLSHLHRTTMARRTLSNLALRYLSATKRQFGVFLGRPAPFNSLIEQFAKVYGSMPRPWETDTKDELRRQVDDLHQQISGQIDVRMREAEQELQLVAARPWLGWRLAELARLAAAVAQLELDRLLDSASVVQDFCCAALGRTPPDATKSLRFTQPAPAAFGADVDAQLAPLLLAEVAPAPDALPEAFNAAVATVLESSRAYVDKMTTTVRVDLTKTENELKPKPVKAKAKAPKKGKGPTLDDVPSLEDLEQQRVLAKKLQLVQEWRQVIEEESQRCLAVLEKEVSAVVVAASDLLDILWRCGFQRMRQAAETQQEVDVQSGVEFRRFLLAAVEAEADLEADLEMPLRTDYLRPLQGLDQVAASTRPPDLCQRLRELVLVLRRLAPNGRILRSGLAFLLAQSAAAGRHLPKEWHNLNNQQIEQVLAGHLNGSAEVDWRVVVVGLVALPTPSQKQLLDAASKFEGLWFETALADSAADVRQLLLEVYDNDVTALLASVAAGIPEPLQAFVACCALHQGQRLEAPESQVQLEAALAACCAVTGPEEAAGLATRLQEIWNEAERLGLDDEARRRRNRLVAAGNFEPVDHTQAALQVLLEMPQVQELAAEFFGKPGLAQLVAQVQEQQSESSCP